MTNDTTIPFADPSFADALAELLRDGAQRISRQAVQAELYAFVQTDTDRVGDGRRAVVRNGGQRDRDMLTGVGRVSVARPKTRDRRTPPALLLGIAPAVSKKDTSPWVDPAISYRGVESNLINRF